VKEGFNRVSQIKSLPLEKQL